MVLEQTLRSLSPYLCCPLPSPHKRCFWLFLGFPWIFRKVFQEGRGWQRQEYTISHLYPSAVSSFASNSLKTPTISGMLNPSCLGTGNLHPCPASLEQNLQLRVAPPHVWNAVGMLLTPSLILLFPRDIFMDKRVPPPEIQLLQMDMRHIFPVAL